MRLFDGYCNDGVSAGIWDPFGSLRDIGKPVMFGPFGFQMGHFWTPLAHHRKMAMAKTASKQFRIC